MSTISIHSQLPLDSSCRNCGSSMSTVSIRSQLQTLFRTALARSLPPIREHLGWSLEETGQLLGGIARQTVASIGTADRPELTQAQGKAFCFVLERLERERPEYKNYIRAIFGSNIPSTVPKEILEDSWMDIWFRLFPTPEEKPIDLHALGFVSPSYQVVLDVPLLADPLILGALAPMTEDMVHYNEFCRQWKQPENCVRYTVAQESVEELAYRKDICSPVYTVLDSLKAKDVLRVCGSPESAPLPTDEALLQGIRQLCSFYPVMVMTNRQELAETLQTYRRTTPLPWSLRVVYHVDGRFMDWKELLPLKLLPVPDMPARPQKFTYQSTSWTSTPNIPSPEK